MDLRRTILLLRSFPKLLLIISTIIITAGFKLKQNGCLPLNSGKHPCLKLNYSFFIQCPENWVHINAVGAFFGCFLRLLTWEKRRFFNRKCSGDTFLVQSVPIVKYSVFTALDRQTQKNANSRQVSLSAACRGMFLRFCD